MSPTRDLGAIAASMVLAGALMTGCGGSLVQLAKRGQWEAVDAQARANKRAPRGKGARAWARALVELGRVEEARSVLLTDFRHGGHNASLLALAELERERGLLGIATAHYARLTTIDPDTLSGSASAGAVCDLFRARARAEAALGEALAADTDMRRVALICPTSIDADDRAFLSSLGPAAQAAATAQRSPETLDGLSARQAQGAPAREQELRAQLMLARKRGPRAVAAFADALAVQVAPDDVAVLLAAELAGALGPGMTSRRRLSAWIGDNSLDDLLGAIDTLPDGVREYALLRLSSVREHPEVETYRQAWMVAAGAALAGQGPHEAAKAWRISASVAELSAAEFALNTNLRDMIPAIAPGSPADQPPAAAAPAPARHWSQCVPVDRRSFDQLLTLAWLFEHRGQDLLALELRRSVLVAGYGVGLAQVAEAAVDEVRRQLILGHPWQALAVAEVVPGPLLDEALPALASAVALAHAAGLDDAIAADQNVVWRALGDEWVDEWAPRLEAAQHDLELGPQLGFDSGGRCPGVGQWLDPGEASTARLRELGPDPARSRAALEAAFAELGGPETGALLAAALESDLGLSCSAPVVTLLAAGLHDLRLATLDERLIHAPELSGSLQLQLHAELSLAHAEAARARLLTISAAAVTHDPRALWARAARAGLSHGASAREYAIEALRQVLLHTPGLDDPAARRELLLMRLRDVDGDADLRGGSELARDELRAQLEVYVAEIAASQRWARVDALLWQLAAEPREDGQAWSLLLDALNLDALAFAHPEAAAALQAAATRGAQPGSSGAPDAGITAAPDEGALAQLSGSLALCDEVRERGSDDPLRLVGAAVGCGPQARAQAHVWLLDAAPPERVDAVRALIMAGPVALEAEVERPAIVHSVAALAADELTLRIVFALPLEPVWAVSPRAGHSR